MSTRIMIPIQSEDGMGSKSFILSTDYDETLDQAFPIQTPSSAVEARGQRTFRLEGGRRLFLPTDVPIAFIEENPEV